MHQEEHLNFNKQLLLLFQPAVDLSIWIGDKNYGQELFPTPPTDRDVIDYSRKYDYKEGFRRFSFIFKAISEYKKARHVIFLSIDNTLFPLFCLFRYRSLRHHKFLCIIHNNLDTITRSVVKRRLFKLVNSLLSIRYVVLTEEMRNIINDTLNISSTLIHHPFYSPYRELLLQLPEGPRTFLTLGRQAAEFNNQRLYSEFEGALQKYNGPVAPKLVIGLPEDAELNASSTQALNITLIRGFISAEQYISLFTQATFFLFPDNEDKENRASGTLIDALSQGVIFIAPRRGHFKEFQNCGIFYEPGELQQAILKAITLSQDELKIMRLNIQKKRLEYEAFNREAAKSLLTD